MGKNQSASNLVNIIQYNNGNISFVSGSTTLMQISSSGAITTTGVISGSNALSASYAATASFVTLAQTASFVTTAQTASFVTTAQTASFVANAQSASNAVTAQTASYADALTVAGTLTAQTLVVQTITSSVDFVTGSTRFGSLSSNTHVFTGSISVSGSITTGTANVARGTAFTSPFLTNGGNLATTAGSTVRLGSFSFDAGGNGVGLGIYGLRQATGSNWTTTGIKLQLDVDNSTDLGGNLFISSNGNVGIGTTSPTSSLEIFSVAPSADRTLPHNVLTITAEQGNAPYEGFGGGIVFKNRSYTAGILTSARVRSVLYFSGNPGQNYGAGLAFDITPTTGSALTEAIRIKYDGNVGIGTTNPLGSSVERTIHLSDGGAGYTTLYVTNGTNSLRGIFAIGDAASTISIGTQTNHTLRIVTNDTPRIYITNGGNVGIGTSNPGNIVHAMYSSTGTVNYYDGARYMIQQSSATANNFAGISFLGSGGSDAAAIWTIISSHTVGSTTGALVFGTTNSGGASTERMRITGGGEVGIGGITPTSGNRFWIRGSSSSSSDTSLFIQNNTPSTLFSVRNDGIVTKPLQPAFRAGRSSSYAPGANTVIVFNSTSGFGFNVGGHYNTSNGRFTAPVNGIYNFTACIIWESVGGGQAMDDAFEVKVNGSTAAYSFRRAAYVANTTGIGGYYVDHATVLLNLTAGQYVEVQNRYNLTVHGNQNYCYFTGYLVG